MGGRRTRPQRRHPFTKAELAAEAPNQVLVWDITKLWNGEMVYFYHLRPILDIFAARSLDWRIEHAESWTCSKPVF